MPALRRSFLAGPALAHAANGMAALRVLSLQDNLDSGNTGAIALAGTGTAAMLAPSYKAQVGDADFATAVATPY